MEKLTRELRLRKSERKSSVLGGHISKKIFIMRIFGFKSNKSIDCYAIDKEVPIETCFSTIMPVTDAEILKPLEFSI